MNARQAAKEGKHVATLKFKTNKGSHPMEIPLCYVKPIPEDGGNIGYAIALNNHTGWTKESTSTVTSQIDMIQWYDHSDALTANSYLELHYIPNKNMMQYKFYEDEWEIRYFFGVTFNEPHQPSKETTLYVEALDKEHAIEYIRAAYDLWGQTMTGTKVERGEVPNQTVKTALPKKRLRKMRKLR